MAMEHNAEICCAGADRNQNGATLPSADPKWASRERRVCSPRVLIQINARNPLMRFDFCVVGWR